MDYLLNKTSQSAPFDLATVPIITKSQVQIAQLKKKEIAQEMMTQISVTSPKKSNLPEVDDATCYRKAMDLIPSLQILGPILKSSPPIDLTEKDVEYVHKKEFLIIIGCQLCETRICKERRVPGNFIATK